jgi:copper amine oxidase-like protein
MSTMKKIGSLLLAFSLVVTPAMINADDMEKDMDKDLIKEDILIDDDVNAVEIKEYMTYEGHIVDVNKENGNMSIWVQKEDDKENSQEGTIFHIDEDTLLLSDKTMEKIEKDHFKKDMKVLVFYKADTPMTMSLPPQATPDGVVVLENKDVHFTKIANFNDELVSMDNKLKLNIQEDTPMVDTNGEKVEKEDLEGENLLVFYDKTTRSIPAQTNPHKVILLDEMDMDFDFDWDFDEDLNVFDKIVIDREDEKDLEIKLEDQMYRDEKGVLMVPLREAGEALGYKVTWDVEKRAAQLTKGAQWTEVVIGEGTVGEDNYNFAKMIVKLGTPPVLKDSTAYVPVNFIEEVLQMDISLEDGMLQIEE